jgi:hypothetical protein
MGVEGGGGEGSNRGGRRAREGMEEVWCTTALHQHGPTSGRQDQFVLIYITADSLLDRQQSTIAQVRDQYMLKCNLGKVEALVATQFCKVICNLHKIILV